MKEEKEVSPIFQSVEKNLQIIIDPITRIEGHMALHVVMDAEKRKISDAHSYATMFRGFEIILEGRDPPDSIFINQRICGVCPVPHAYAAALANDMALNASPPPLATVIRDLTDEAEILYDHPIHLFQLAGPDYSQAVVSKFNSNWIDAAKDYTCEFKDVHGCATIAELMEALNPLSGRLYLYTLKMERHARKLASLLGAKHPHVNTFVPGGVSRTWNANEAEETLSMVFALAGFSKLVVTVWEDMCRFLYDIGYEMVGARPANLLAYGTLDDPEVYDGKYENMTEFGNKRLFPPGVVDKGELITHDLTEIHLGVREFVDHSYYKMWSQEFTKDPIGNPLDAHHPWNKETIPNPVSRSWDGKYSWGMCIRWYDRSGEKHVVEVGPLARIYVSALAGLTNFDSPYSAIKTGGGRVRISLPVTRSELLPSQLWDPMEFEWRVPSFSIGGIAHVNTIERLRARAYNHAYYAACALLNALQMITYMGKGKTEVWTKFERPGFSMGVGLNEAARGALGHWIVVKNGRIHRYQVITPTAWNISPLDPDGEHGPVEQAEIDSPVTESNDPSNWVGVDAMRVVRSYDPCLACTVHMYSGGRLIKKQRFSPISG